jgi:S-adenosylmethionine:tRNA ribosyltransferase-isomerase
MKLKDFDFHVPEELVAQRPLEQRDGARMLVLDRKTGKIEHRRFLDLPEYFTREDLLVFNKSKVLKARLIGQRATGGKVETFLLKNLGAGKYECLVKATAAKKTGLEVSFGENLRGAVGLETATPMIYEVQLEATDGRIDHWIEQYGRIPLPPYIHRDADTADLGRYQTVYASELGSVAAPTAGLHFTDAMFAALKSKGIQTGEVILHVGLGTFQPIKVESIDDHFMHRESFYVSDELQAQLKAAGRVVAVGTTSVRALESKARGFEGDTNLFLKPGEKFLAVDALFTNFHQPKSSLIVMLSAFAGSVELVRETYAKAVEEKYRFFSYGDCMLVL